MTESNSGRAKPRRRRSRRHRRGADLGDSTPTSARAESIAAATPVGKNHSRPSRRSSPHLPTVHEFSAGGLVVDGLDRAKQVALLIGRSDRRGGMVWTLPKGHIEVGERAEQTAIREIAEETGVRGEVLAALGSIDFWFRAEHHVVHKTVHHYLLRFLDGQPSANDHEVREVAWVPLDELASRLTHADERQLAAVAAHMVETLRTHGPAALPPLPRSSPRRSSQTHSIARRHSGGEPTSHHGHARNSDRGQPG